MRNTSIVNHFGLINELVKWPNVHFLVSRHINKFQNFPLLDQNWSDATRNRTSTENELGTKLEQKMKSRRKAKLSFTVLVVRE